MMCLLMVGCAAKKSATAPVRTDAGYLDGSAGALVFDPPLTLGQSPVMLAREPRQAQVVLGYEELTTTFFYVRTEDRQDSDRGDRFKREAIIERVGISYR